LGHQKRQNGLRESQEATTGNGEWNFKGQGFRIHEKRYVPAIREGSRAGPQKEKESLNRKRVDADEFPVTSVLQRLRGGHRGKGKGGRLTLDPGIGCRQTSSKDVTAKKLEGESAGRARVSVVRERTYCCPVSGGRPTTKRGR